MSNDLSSLTEDHVRHLGHIIGTLEQSTFDFLQLEIGDLKVTIGKGNVPAPDAPAAGPQPVAAVPVSTGASAPLPQAEKELAAPLPSPPTAAGAAEITSPIMGMFYTRAEPGAPHFVTIGTVVEDDSTVGLVEVMKTFNAVTAGVRGTIVEVCVPDAQLVEYGQVLFRVAQG